MGRRPRSRRSTCWRGHVIDACQPRHTHTGFLAFLDKIDRQTSRKRDFRLVHRRPAVRRSRSGRPDPPTRSRAPTASPPAQAFTEASLVKATGLTTVEYRRFSRMIISRENRFLVFAPWKTASETIRHRLQAYNDSPYSPFFDFNPYLRRVLNQHLTCVDFSCPPKAASGILPLPSFGTPTTACTRAFGNFRRTFSNNLIALSLSPGFAISS